MRRNRSYVVLSPILSTNRRLFEHNRVFLLSSVRVTGLRKRIGEGIERLITYLIDIFTVQVGNSALSASAPPAAALACFFVKELWQLPDFRLAMFLKNTL